MRLSVATLILVVVQSAAPLQRLPAELDRYLTKYVSLTPAQRADLVAGRPVTRLLESDPAKEVAVFGAVWGSGSNAAKTSSSRGR